MRWQKSNNRSVWVSCNFYTIHLVNRVYVCYCPSNKKIAQRFSLLFAKRYCEDHNKRFELMNKILYTWRKNNAAHYGYYNTNSGVMVGKVTMQGRKWQASLKGFRPKSFKQLNEAKRYVTDQTSKRLNNG